MKDFEYDRKRAMKQTDFTPCVRCHKGVMHTGLSFFYRIKIEHMGIDAQAVQRQAGLEMMMGGHAQLANVMGANEDMGLPIGDASTGLLCHKCATDLKLSFAEIVESMNAKTEETDAV